MRRNSEYKIFACAYTGPCIEIWPLSLASRPTRSIILPLSQKKNQALSMRSPSAHSRSLTLPVQRLRATQTPRGYAIPHRSTALPYLNCMGYNPRRMGIFVIWAESFTGQWQVAKQYWLWTSCPADVEFQDIDHGDSHPCGSSGVEVIHS
jgi:hypothetical protein